MTDLLPDPPDPVSTPLEQPAGETGRGLFARFVAAEDDVVGLLAYALHRQNRHDWLAAFRRQTGREPDPREDQAFGVGEGIERRLAGYRRQAETLLDARVRPAGAPAMPPLPLAEGEATSLPVSRASNRVDPALARRKIVAGLVVFVLLVAGVILARRTMGI